MYKRNGNTHIVKVPRTSSMMPVVAKQPSQTLREIYDSMEVKPDILLSGNMFHMKTGEPANGLKIGNKLWQKANYGGHILYAKDGKYNIERFPNIHVESEWALEGVGMIKPFDDTNIRPYFITGKNERMTIGLSKDSIHVVAFKDEVNFDTMRKVYDEEEIELGLNLDGGGSVGLIVNGEEVVHSPRKIDNAIAIYFNKADKKNIFILDAGHGPDTPGKRTPDGMHEFEFNKPVAEGIGDYLKSRYDNVEIHYVHDTEGKIDIPLQDRTDKANAIYDQNRGENVTYISFHANAYGNGDWNNANGISTFVYGFRYNEAYSLAKALQSALVTSTGLYDRGTKEADFHVLRETKMTAVLIEHGFMTNREEAELLKSDAYRKLCAETDAKTIANHYGLKPKDNEIAKLKLKILDLENQIQTLRNENYVLKKDKSKLERIAKIIQE